jgi:hypothetical protein
MAGIAMFGGDDSTGGTTLRAMLLRPFLFEATSCASYLFGCTTHGKLAVVDPHVELVETYIE